ncbi:hypothetical protein [Streptomyces sp. NBC_00356]|uniref:hypothetical protein n=1 Tax=Streptomyces sp. NBC_00356 TaxID=2975724 RepID=UPI002E25D639
MAGRHGQHDAIAAAFGHVDPGGVDEVEVAGLHLAPVGEHGGERARGPAHGDLPLNGEQLGEQCRFRAGGDSSAL